MDDEIAEGAGGTLRGAMQGKADHVVYGPRRIDGIAPGTPGVSSVSAATSGASSPIIASRGSSSPSSSKNHTRPNSIALPPSIHVLSPALLVDPDDTTSPHFKGSPRLTSQVLLSQDRMPVIVSPITEEPPRMIMADGREINHVEYGFRASKVFTPSLLSTGMSTPDALVAPGSSAPFPPVEPPSDTIFTKAKSIADKEDGILTPVSIASASSSFTSPQLLLSPEILKAPSAAVPIPIAAIHSTGDLASSLLASVVDLGAGPEGVPTLIKWTNEDGQSGGDGVKEEGPKEVFVTGTFAKGWKTKIELRKTASVLSRSLLLTMY